MKTSIVGVSDKPRSFNTQHGERWSVDGDFGSGESFEVVAMSEAKAIQYMAELKALLNKEEEFVVEDTGRAYRGKPKMKLKHWPGKPVMGSGFEGRFKGGGGGGYQVPFRHTEDGTHQERLSIARSVALQEAIVFAGQVGIKSASDVLPVADVYYNWLVANQVAPKPAFQQAAEIEAQTPITVGAHSAQPPQQSSGRKPWEEKPPCPNCGAKDAVGYAADRDEYYCWKKKDTELFDPAGNIKKGCGHKWPKSAPATAPVVTGDSIPTAFEKYRAEISKAVQDKSADRLTKLSEMAAQSLDAGSLSLDEASWLEDDMKAGRQALTSAAAHKEWYDRQVKQKQLEGADF